MRKESKMQKQEDCWLIGLLSKRAPDAVAILTDLVQAGLRNGEASANDISPRNLAEPNIIGGTFKILPRFGFVHTDRRVKTVAKMKHARRVDVWALVDRSKAESFVEHQRRCLIGKAAEVQNLPGF